MKRKCSLSDISCGDRCRVLRLLVSGNIRRRLQDLGIICGTEIECIIRSPMGDPAAFLVRGAVIALRDEDSKLIEVEVI